VLKRELKPKQELKFYDKVGFMLKYEIYRFVPEHVIRDVLRRARDDLLQEFAYELLVEGLDPMNFDPKDKTTRRAFHRALRHTYRFLGWKQNRRTYKYETEYELYGEEDTLDAIASETI